MLLRWSVVWANALREHGVAPRYLEIEITESSAMQNADASIGTLAEGRRLERPSGRADEAISKLLLGGNDHDRAAAA